MEKKLEPGFRGWGRTNAGGAKDRCATTTQPGSEKTAWKCQKTTRPPMPYGKNPSPEPFINRLRIPFA